jgi:large subunit ribosomal protein L25
MKLKTEERVQGKKSVLNRIRHEKNIPAILYGNEGNTTSLTIDGADFARALRAIDKGHLGTTVFELEIQGSAFKAIVKDIQYHKTTYNILHLDFQKLEKEVPVTLNVPVTFAGSDECPGVKLGGFLRQVKRTVRVSCLPSHLPKSFVLDVRSLGMRQSKRIKDLDLPSHIRVIDDLENVVVTIAK